MDDACMHARSEITVSARLSGLITLKKKEREKKKAQQLIATSSAPPHPAISSFDIIETFSCPRNEGSLDWLTCKSKIGLQAACTKLPICNSQQMHLLV